ncbi:hypothetical protein SCARD494_00954 [Seiridium cardinale]
MGRSLSITAAVAVLAFAAPVLWRLVSTYDRPSLLAFTSLAPFLNTTSSPKAFTCQPHSYTTEIISLDPLVIYIHNFIGDREVTALLAAGEPEFAPSEVTKHSRKVSTSDRTSQSAGLPLADPAVQCVPYQKKQRLTPDVVVSRAEKFMGTMLDPVHDEIGPPQLVRYTAGQRFNIHHDWYERPQPARRDKMHKGRSWNRVASFFAVLEDGCTGGETHFPYLKPLRRAGKGQWLDPKGAEVNNTWYEREDEDGGGVAFKPVKGNAVFWVNLHANGTGDERVMHAGLPLGEGLKTAMNIWPRQYYV